MKHLAEVEIRATGEGVRELRGTIIQEGRAGRRRRELFAPGSIEWPADGIEVLTEHRGAPEVRGEVTRKMDGRITIRAAATDAIRQAVEGGKRFMSVEFHSLRERTTEGGVREILRALVPGVALVSSPEYDMTAAEVRSTANDTWRALAWR